MWEIMQAFWDMWKSDFWDYVQYFFGILVFIYSISLMASYVLLTHNSMRVQHYDKMVTPDPAVVKYMLKDNPDLPGVSLVAPAHNEAKTIIDNVHSLLRVEYPKYEIVVVNDGSTDDTLELLMKEFKLEPVAFDYHEHVPSCKVKNLYRSKRKGCEHLVVVDKECIGKKADAVNAGVNVSQYPYFVCTDVDGIVDPMSLYRIMWLVVTNPKRVIGVSATMLMSNGCEVEDGRLVKYNVSRRFLPMCQQLEYLRSFIIGKMGWYRRNVLPCISGGFGLFDKDIVIKTGGYDTTSLAEDMDILIRMVRYMSDRKQEYALIQVPQALYWTEGPSTLKVLYRQRSRWAKGLCQVIHQHKTIMFRKKYGRTGTLMLPYQFMFEFLAPIIESFGVLFTIWLVLTNKLNWNTFWLIFLMIYVFAQLITCATCLLDYTLTRPRWTKPTHGYPRLFLASLLEPFTYHPFITYCSVRGYIDYMLKRNMGWGTMTRTGHKHTKNAATEPEEESPAETAADTIDQSERKEDSK